MTTSLAATAAPASPSSTASTSPTFSFQTVPEMFTCGITQIHWTYVGPHGQLTLNISNINVPQQAPYTPPAPSATAPASSASAAPVSIPSSPLFAKRQYNGYGGSYLPPINMILVSGIDPTVDVWQWNAVAVPQGWYVIWANVQGVPQTFSASFFVSNGSDTACVTQFAASAPKTPLSTSSTQGPGSTVIATSSGHSHAGAIAGGVIGGIAFFAAALVAFLYFCLRRRSARSNLHDEYGYSSSGRRWSMLSFNQSRPGTYPRSSIQKHHSGLPSLDANQTFVGTDEELSTIAHEKAIAASLPPVQPTRSRSQRASTQTNPSNSNAAFNTESPVRRTPSYRAQPVEAIPLERTHTNQSYNRSHSNSEPPVSRSGTYAASPPTVVTLERTPTGGGSRRKPAPCYEDALQAETEAERARSSSHATPSSSFGTTNGGGSSLGDQPLLRHQNSFGAMRPMHVMMPDPPPAAHK